MPEQQNNRRLVTATGLLTLYAVGCTAYIATLSPQLTFLGSSQQKALTRALELESRLREVAGLTNHEETFSVTFRQEQGSEQVRAYVRRTSLDYPFIALPDIVSEHPHAAEMRAGNLYLLRDVESGGQTVPELWRYDISGSGERQYAGVRDFRVSPSAAVTALKTDTADLVLVRMDTGEERRLGWNDLTGSLQEALAQKAKQSSPPDVRLLSWSTDGTALWGALHWDDTPEALFRIQPVSGVVQTFDVSTLGFSTEYALEPTRGLLAYSTYREGLTGTYSPVGLRVRNLLSGTESAVASAQGHRFRPRWLASGTLEFLHPQLAVPAVTEIE